MSRFATVIAVGALCAGLAWANDAAATTKKPVKGGRAPAQSAPRAPRAPSAPNAANAPAAGAGLISIEVCNNSAQAAKVALSYIQPGESRFINRGWFTVAPGRCEVLGQTDNATFYGYADVDGTDRSWQGELPLCVEYPGPYTFYTMGSTCDEDQVTRDFVEKVATGAGTHTWNLDP